MATIKVKFRPSSSDEQRGTLYYQVTHKRKSRQLSYRYKIFRSEWDSNGSRVIIAPDTGAKRQDYLVFLERCIKEDIARFRNILVKLFREGKEYTVDDVVALYSSAREEESFLSFCRGLIRQLEQMGKSRTAEHYTTALNSFMRFRSRAGDIPLDEVDSGLMLAHEAYLRAKGICPNSSSYYMRNLRAMYNRAVDKELVVQRNPFKHVYTGIDKTVKRAVPARIIRQLRDLELSSLLDYARDLFMFSFYTRGMSFVDMAFLKKEDLQNGILSYRRRKTGQQLFIKWEKPMQEIVAKYNTAGSPYLLPIIKRAGKNERKQYRSAEHLINRKLRKIGEQLGLEQPLTTYVARHGWASIAKSKNIPIATISEAMGHDSESTTRIYLASLDASVVDKANRVILKSI